MSKQKAPLENLKVIRDELKKRNWAVDAFLFQYKKQEYVVLVKIYSDKEKKDSKYAIAKLEFIKKRNKNESLCTYADLYKIHISDMKSFRNFFGIEYGENLGDVIQQFTQYFSTFIPNQLMAHKELSLNIFITDHLNKIDSESSRGSYCIGVKRNGIKKDGTPKQRSPENNQKAELLRPELLKKLREDTTLSFCFSEDPTKENTNEDILLRWAERKKNFSGTRT